MFPRWMSMLVCLLVIPQAAPAQEKKSTPPTIVVRVRSVDTVIENVKLVVTLAGRENIAQQIEGLIKTKVGPKGLEGIDPKRPFGGYARFGELLQMAGVIMIPIADENAFLGLLENLNFKATKDKKGLYSVKTGLQEDVYFRFAHKYAYATALNLEALEPANLIEPSKIFPGRQETAFSATVRLEQIPGAVKQIASFQFEQELSKIRDKKEPGETEKQKEFRAAVLTEISKKFKAILEEGGELNANLDINKKSGELLAEVNFSGKSGSNLAKEIRDMAKTASLFGNLAGADSAARGLVHYLLPPSIREAFDSVVDEVVAKGLAGINDEGRRKRAEGLLKVLVPTLKAGEIDAAFNFTKAGASKVYNLVAAVKLKNGGELGKTVRDLAAELLKEVPAAEAAKVKLDADSVEGVKIHRIDVRPSSPAAQAKFDEKLKRVFGADPKLYVAFRKDALFLALGEDGLDAIKKAITTRPADASPTFLVNASVARLAPLLAKTEQQREMIRSRFNKEDQGRVNLTLEGGGSLQFRLTTQLSVLEFFSSAIGKGNFKLGD
jgi:hypothetical protein